MPRMPSQDDPSLIEVSAASLVVLRKHPSQSSESLMLADADSVSLVFALDLDEVVISEEAIVVMAGAVGTFGSGSYKFLVAVFRYLRLVPIERREAEREACTTVLAETPKGKNGRLYD